MNPLNHLNAARWQTLLEAELSPDEAEHLGICLLCQARWESALDVPALEHLRLEPAPLGLLPAALHAFDGALQARARARSRALLGVCLASNLLGWAALAWLFPEPASLLAQFSMVIGQSWTVLGVIVRLLAHFPTFALSYASALTVSALVLASFWSHAWRTSLAHVVK
jgi:hypothetical protein